MSTSRDLQATTIGHLVSKELLEALREVFPFLRPQLADTERSIFMRSGEQAVIEFLQRQHDEALQQALS